MNKTLMTLFAVAVLNACLNASTGVDYQVASGGGSLGKAAVDGPSNDLDNDGRPPSVDGWTAVPIDVGILWLDIRLDEQTQVDLAGVGLLAQLELEGGELTARGTVGQGAYLDGVVDVRGSLTLAGPWIYSGQGYVASLASGKVSVNVTQSSLARASFSGEVTVEIDMGNSEGDTLRMKGSLNHGTYTPDKGVDFSGTLTYVPTFTYKTDRVSVAFNDGSVTVEIEQSEFKKAVLNVNAEVDITIEEDVLKLDGPIKGEINDGCDIDFHGSITVKSDFTKSLGERVTITLKRGGKLGVEVESSEFKWAKLEDITVEAKIKVGGKDLELNGEVRGGKYDTNGLDLEASLGLLEVFTYDKEPVSVTLAPDGDVGVTVKDNELKKATFAGLTCTVTVMDSDGTHQTVTGVLDKGVYRNGTLRLRSDEFKEADLPRMIVVRIDDNDEDDEEENERPVDGTGN